MAKIIIDVDITLLDLSDSWLEWLNSFAKYFYEDEYIEDCTNDYVNYNLGDYFILPQGIDPIDFWRHPERYDGEVIYPEAKEVLNKLIDDGHEIIFVSDCCGEHYISKQKMLQREVPRASNFISTSIKSDILADIIVDDRLKYINQFKDYPKDFLAIWYGTRYNQCQDFDASMNCYKASCWKDIYSLIDYYCQTKN